MVKEILGFDHSGEILFTIQASWMGPCSLSGAFMLAHHLIHRSGQAGWGLTAERRASPKVLAERLRLCRIECRARRSFCIDSGGHSVLIALMGHPFAGTRTIADDRK